MKVQCTNLFDDWADQSLVLKISMVHVLPQLNFSPKFVTSGKLIFKFMSLDHLEIMPKEHRTKTMKLLWRNVCGP